MQDDGRRRRKEKSGIEDDRVKGRGWRRGKEDRRGRIGQGRRR